MPERDDEIFKALADRHRRRILAALCRGPMVAGELARLVGLAPNAVSFHLKVLQTTHLVSVQREGRFLRYRANASTLGRWRAHVNDLFSETAGESSTDADAIEAASSYPAKRSPAEGRSVETAPPSPADEIHYDNDALPTELL